MEKKQITRKEWFQSMSYKLGITRKIWFQSRK